MSHRTRLLLGFSVVALGPLVALGVGVRHVVSDRLLRQQEERVESLAAVVEAGLRRADVAVAERLRALEEQLTRDNRIRLAAVQGIGSERAYLLDWAEGAMALTGLSMLQLQDEDGRIVSSGHFRHEFDRLDAALPALLRAAGGVAVVEARSPEGPFLALARGRPVPVAGRTFWLVGGHALDDAFLAGLSPGGSDLHVALRRDGREEVPGTASAPGMRIVRSVAVPIIAPAAAGGPEVGSARIVVSQGTGRTAALRASVDRWFLLALGGGALSVVLVASWLSALMSRPLTELSREAARLDLDRLDARFGTDRADEVGRLSSALARMVDRLRTSVERLREAERRAAFGELARQVNHDIKNGLAPIRNVLRHLSGIEEGNAEGLESAFRQREATLRSSVAYLESLAASCARLAPPAESGTCDANDVVRDVLFGARGAAGTDVELTARQGPGLPAVAAHPLVLRRIVENLVTNALDAAREGGCRVSVSTAHGVGPEGTGEVLVAVADDGRGMTEGELRRAFEDFYTTKEGGSGLGLSVVRRLLLDVGGRLEVDSAPGRGTTFTVAVPAAGFPEVGGATAGSDGPVGRLAPGSGASQGRGAGRGPSDGTGG